MSWMRYLFFQKLWKRLHSYHKMEDEVKVNKKGEIVPPDDDEPLPTPPKLTRQHAQFAPFTFHEDRAFGYYQLQKEKENLLE